MKRIVKVDGASHRGAMSLDPGEYGRALADFMQSAVGGAPMTASGGTAGAAAAAATLMH
jgi:hypothetical protein